MYLISLLVISSVVVDCVEGIVGSAVCRGSIVVDGGVIGDAIGRLGVVCGVVGGGVVGGGVVGGGVVGGGVVGGGIVGMMMVSGGQVEPLA